MTSELIYKVFLFITKAIKVIFIKFGFVFPTIKTKFILSLIGCKYGKGLRVCGPIYIRINKIGAISIGNQVSLTARFLTNTVGITNPLILECLSDGLIKIGSNSGITSSIISSRSMISIGENVKIGANVRIFDHDYHSIDYRKRRVAREDYAGVKSLAINIEDDVFIGTNCIILKGVNIGKRSIIAAGSVVSIKDIPADSFVAGNPAKIVKQLNNENQ